MPGWLGFLSFLMIVWGILEIILFFKIWGMTNDIKALKEDHFYEKAQSASFLRKNLVLGNIDNVKRILLQNFIDNVEHGYGELRTGGYEKDENGAEKWVSYEEKNMKESIVPYVKQLMMQFAKIGEEVPVYLTKMETFGDYYSLMAEEDLLYPDSSKTMDSEKEEIKEEQTNETKTSSNKILYYIIIPIIAVIAFLIGVAIFHVNNSYKYMWDEESNIIVQAFIVFAAVIGLYYIVVNKMMKK